jgi:hypothetical protein
MVLDRQECDALVMTDDKQARRRARPPWRTRRRARPPWRTLPELPDDEAKAKDLPWKDLRDQFYWYDGAAIRHENAFLLLKIVTLLLGGVVTILAALSSSAVLTASLAAAIVAAEGIQQLFQLHRVWLDYRSTAEALRQVAWSYVMHEKPYHDPETRSTKLPAPSGLSSPQSSPTGPVCAGRAATAVRKSASWRLLQAATAHRRPAHGLMPERMLRLPGRTDRYEPQMARSLWPIRHICWM